MGSYFALMEKAARRGEDYEDLDFIRDVLSRFQKRQATPQEILKVLEKLSDLNAQLTGFLRQVGPEKAPRVEEALKRLEGLIQALQPSSSAARK